MVKETLDIYTMNQIFLFFSGLERRFEKACYIDVTLVFLERMLRV